MVWSIANTLYKLTEETLASLDGRVAACSSTLEALCGELSRLVDQAFVETNVAAVVVRLFCHSLIVHLMHDLQATPSPLQLRAASVCKDYSMNEGLRSTIDALKADNVSTARELLLRDQRAAEAMAKVELLEKRLESSKRFTDRAAEYEAQIDKFKADETKLAEAIESLQQENDALEKENKELRKDAKKVRFNTFWFFLLTFCSARRCDWLWTGRSDWHGRRGRGQQPAQGARDGARGQRDPSHEAGQSGDAAA